MNAIISLYRRIFPFSAAGAGVPGIDGDEPNHALNLKTAQAMLARRKRRLVTNAAAKRAAATKIHKQFERDPLIKARNMANV